MKLDTSSYYPKSQFDDSDFDNASGPESEATPQEAATPETPKSHAPVLVTASDEEDSDTGFEKPEPEPEGALAESLTRLSNVLSWVFVPLLMPVYGTILAFSTSILAFVSPGTQFAFTLIVAAFNLIAPAIIFALLKKMNVISDIGLNKRRERTLPYAICILCLLGTAVFMWSKGAPLWLVMFYGGGAAAGLVELVVNRWWKISVHAAGMAGVVALLIRILVSGYPRPGIMIWIIIAVIATGMLGSARVWLGRHTVTQVMAGYAVGFLAVYLLSGI